MKLFLNNTFLTERSDRSWPLSGGGKGDMPPGRHCGGSDIWRVENMELWNLAASDELAFALQTVIFLHPPNTPNTVTLPQIWDHTPTVSSSLPITQTHRPTAFWPACMAIVVIIRPPDIVVRGLIFYQGFFFFFLSFFFFLFSPPNLRARWTELNQNRPHARK